VLRHILIRLLLMIPVLLGVAFVVFTLMYITPGDPAKIILGDAATAEAIEALREEMGLNDSFAVRFGRYIGDIFLRFDFGNSYQTGRSVLGELLQRFPATVKLAAYSGLVSVIIGVILGIISAIKQYSWFDNISSAVGIVGVAMPNFWLGMMLVLIFSVKLKLLPASGTYGPQYWVLPSLTLGLISAASIMRTTRSCMLEVIRQDYIVTARAKGQSEWIIIVYHALKNALIPIVTVVGIQFGHLLGGSVLVETVFSIPGIGRYMIDAIKARDYPIVQGGVLFLSACFSFVNLAVDILYSFLDPRMKSMFNREKKRRMIIKTGKEAKSNG
jgi:peptide/nickel transport system permease protein